jgi:hypothetical protein
MGCGTVILNVVVAAVTKKIGNVGGRQRGKVEL